LKRLIIKYKRGSNEESKRKQLRVKDELKPKSLFRSCLILTYFRGKKNQRVGTKIKNKVIRVKTKKENITGGQKGGRRE